MIPSKKYLPFSPTRVKWYALIFCKFSTGSRCWLISIYLFWLLIFSMSGSLSYCTTPLPLFTSFASPILSFLTPLLASNAIKHFPFSLASDFSIHSHHALKITFLIPMNASLPPMLLPSHSFNPAFSFPWCPTSDSLRTPSCMHYYFEIFHLSISLGDTTLFWVDIILDK